MKEKNAQLNKGPSMGGKQEKEKKPIRREYKFDAGTLHRTRANKTSSAREEQRSGVRENLRLLNSSDCRTGQVDL